jgi:hypothetical protein
MGYEQSKNGANKSCKSIPTEFKISTENIIKETLVKKHRQSNKNDNDEQNEPVAKCIAVDDKSKETDKKLSTQIDTLTTENKQEVISGTGSSGNANNENKEQIQSNQVSRADDDKFKEIDKKLSFQIDPLTTKNKQEVILQVDSNGNLNMKKKEYPRRYILMDHGGVLEGEYSDQAPLDNDILIKQLSEEDFMVLKDGVDVIKDLIHLVENCNCILLFHSKNKMKEQFQLINYLKKGCDLKGLKMPEIPSIAVYDKVVYNGYSCDNPEVKDEKNIWDTDKVVQVAGYGTELYGKECIRMAISSLYKIDNSSRHLHFIVDDGDKVIDKANQDGWNGCLVGIVVLRDVVKEIRRKIENEAIK